MNINYMDYYKTVNSTHTHTYTHSGDIPFDRNESLGFNRKFQLVTNYRTKGINSWFPMCSCKQIQINLMKGTISQLQHNI